MRRLAGQVIQPAASFCALLGQGLVTAAWLLPLALLAVAWRLSTGPLDVTEPARTVLSRHVSAMRIGAVTLAWDGFRHPAANITVAARAVAVAAQGSQGHLDEMRAEVPMEALLRGQPAPQTLTLSGLRADLAARLWQTSPPRSGGDAGGQDAMSRLRHVRVRDVSLSIAGMPVRLEKADITMDRAGDGGWAGRGHADLSAAGQHASLDVGAHVAADGSGSDIDARLSPIDPARLAALAPALRMLDAPVTLSGQASLDGHLSPKTFAARLEVGDGVVYAGTGSAPLRAVDLRVRGTPTHLDATLVRLDTSATPGSAMTHLAGSATADRTPAGYAVSAALTVDQLDFADLPALWPAGTGGPGSRPWITKNITAGRVADGRLALDLTLPADLSDVALTRIDGAIDGHDVTVHWLRPVPPLQHAEGRLTIKDPDVIDVAVSTAQQAMPGDATSQLNYADALIHMTGIAGKDQFADIRTRIAGPVAQLLTILKNPKIKLLDKRPVPMDRPSGGVTALIRVAHLPLKDTVQMDDLAISTAAHFSRLHLGKIAVGQDLDDGDIDLSADNDGLLAKGHAALAGMPSRLTVNMDFRNGPPAQLVEAVDVAGTLPIARLARLGIDTGGRLRGSVDLQAHIRTQRNGLRRIALDGDLEHLAIAEPRLALDKPLGVPGTANMRATLQNDRLLSIDALRLDTRGVSVAAAAEVTAGQPATLNIERLVLGSGTDVHGRIRLPSAPGGLLVELAGPRLDVSALSQGSDAPSREGAATRAAPARPGGDTMGRLMDAPWHADIAIDQVTLAPDRALLGLRARGAYDGHRLNDVRLDAKAQAGGRLSPLHADILPEPGGRRLTATIPDLGGVLHAVGVYDALIGGDLRLAARWDDLQRASPPLSGLVHLTEFRLRDAPAIGRILQALTIYGLVDLARGPGLGFSRLEAPFSWQDDTLTLREAHAFSASLGFTAQGYVDFGRRRLDMKGTVVPAYFFNALLGRLPVVGSLFTAERGGGLFAAAVRLRGPLDDYSISVNPLSVVTPGILRGLFGTDLPPQPAVTER